MNPEYFEVEIGGKKLTVFYPQFEDGGEWKVISEDNHLPVVLKDHEDYLEYLEYNSVAVEATAEKLEELADLIEQMALLAKGPKGDPFVYEDFTPEQLDDLKGEKGDPLKFDDLTPEQKEELTGPEGPPNTQAQSDIDAHKDDKNNPHNVTKSQAGLGSVLNYGVATKSEAENGTINTKYMTPLRTKEAIASITIPEVTNTPYGKCVKHPDGTLEYFGFDIVMDRHISMSYKRVDVEFSIPFIDENYYVSSSIVMGLAKNPLPYTRTKASNSVEMAVRSISTDFDAADEVSIDLYAIGRWK